MRQLEIYSYELKTPVGVVFPVNSFIVQDNGKIVVIGPGAFDNKTIESIKAKDESPTFIAPNNFHNTYISKMKELFPEAKCYGPKRSAKVSGLNLIPTKEFVSDALSAIPIKGNRGLSETCFYHHESKTMLVTDLVFNIKKAKNFASNIMFTLSGTRGRPAISRLVRFTRTNRSEFKESVKKLLDFPFEKLVPAHGDPLDRKEFEKLIGVYL